MYKLCIDAVVREWLYQTLDEDTARDRIDNQLAKILMVFYVDNGLLAS
jgi:hypothetical protein